MSAKIANGLQSSTIFKALKGHLIRRIQSKKLIMVSHSYADNVECMGIYSTFHKTDCHLTGLKIASDWSPWATKNRPGRLEIMIQEPIGELRIGLSQCQPRQWIRYRFLFQCLYLLSLWGSWSGSMSLK